MHLSGVLFTGETNLRVIAWPVVKLLLIFSPNFFPQKAFDILNPRILLYFNYDIPIGCDLARAFMTNYIYFIHKNPLPTSFHLNRLVDLLALKDGSAEAQRCSSCDENNTATCYCFVCQNFLCEACFEAHQRLKATRGHRNILVENLQAQDVQELIRRPVMCSQQYHEDQTLEYYCEECKVCICYKCSVVSHNRHSMVDMQKAADEHKMQIADALKKVKTQVAVYENQMKKEKELMEKSELEISAAQRKMVETVDNCIRILTEHKSAMNAKFDDINQAQQKAHATQLENFQFAVNQLKSSVEQGENIL